MPNRPCHGRLMCPKPGPYSSMSALGLLALVAHGCFSLVMALDWTPLMTSASADDECMASEDCASHLLQAPSHPESIVRWTL